MVKHTAHNGCNEGSSPFKSIFLILSLFGEMVDTTDLKSVLYKVLVQVQ